jgi:hypothetical protein
MAFQRFGPTRRPSKNELVVGVGSRAYVNWHPPIGSNGQGVPMLDGTGAQLSNNLTDGEEVEILSWLPRSREGLTYQIRRMKDRSEWWIAATYLRRSKVAAPETVVAEKASQA